MDFDVDHLAGAMMHIILTHPASDHEGNPYWYSFPGFVPHPQAKVKNQFKRLAKHMGWTGQEYADQKARAYESEFGYQFTEGKTDLEAWQALCREVSIDPVPETITKCRKALKGVLVNINDLMDHRRNPNIPVRIFKNFAEFRKYTSKNTFPKVLAKQEGFIRDLLRHVTH